MRILPLSEVQQMDDKEVIRCVKGVITKIYKAKRGIGTTNKPWSIQDFFIKDDAGTEMKVKVKDRASEADDVPLNWRGKEVYIEAHSGDKGLSGVYMFHDDYTDPPVLTIRVTATGQVYLADEGAPQQPASPPAKKPAPPPPAKQKPRAAGPPPTTRQDAEPAAQPPSLEEQKAARAAKESAALYAAKVGLAQLANLYCLSVDATTKVVQPHYLRATGEPMDAETFHTTVATLFIGAQRAHLDIGLQVRPLETKPPEPPLCGAYPEIDGGCKLAQGHEGDHSNEPAPPPPPQQQPASSPLKDGWPPEDDEIPF